MGAAGAALVIGGMFSGAMSARGAAKAGQKMAKFQQAEANKAQSMERQRLDAIKYSPGAAASPMLFNSILDVFTNSMAGKMSGAGANTDWVRQAMGLTNADGSLGPLWYGPNEYSSWASKRRSRDLRAADPHRTVPVNRERKLPPIDELLGREISSGLRGS